MISSFCTDFICDRSSYILMHIFGFKLELNENIDFLNWLYCRNRRWSKTKKYKTHIIW